MSKESYDIGVIIGRFQVHELHAGHKQMINEVLSNHKKVIVFLGVPAVVGTKNNPLDFVSRKLMFDEEFGDKISVILPLKDKKTDIAWSNQVDEKIREVFSMGSVVLYGSRDSFIPHYHGKFDTKELKQDVFVSGTEVRKDVSEDIKKSSLFRAGVIYGIYNRHETMFGTIDVAIKMPSGKYLMARKPYEDKYRFVGGFSSVNDTSDIATVRREAKEEVGINLENFQFITSFRVDDWRYRNVEDEKIMTRFYHAEYAQGNVRPDDDISEAREFDLSELNSENIVEEHLPLLKELKLFLKSKN